ncbi:hypothetical protein Bca52824_054952 [Brassica carinata]|uniref:Uncharacterized protein n=1 Tax=Brassica carinata TaxID=52824 RepID=A0A8X7R8X7_BRACI|nr:hypothetical protein Bca52824_054952 [Brassica carinata]
MASASKNPFSMKPPRPPSSLAASTTPWPPPQPSPKFGSLTLTLAQTPRHPHQIHRSRCHQRTKPSRDPVTSRARSFSGADRTTSSSSPSATETITGR